MSILKVVLLGLMSQIGLWMLHLLGDVWGRHVFGSQPRHSSRVQLLVVPHGLLFADWDVSLARLLVESTIAVGALRV